MVPVGYYFCAPVGVKCEVGSMFLIKLLLFVAVSLVGWGSQAVSLPARFVQLTESLLAVRNGDVIALKINGGKFLQVQTDNKIKPLGQVIKKSDKIPGIDGTLPFSCEFHVGAIKRTSGQPGFTCTLHARHSSSGALKPLVLNFGLTLLLGAKITPFSTLALVPDPDDTAGWILTSPRNQNWQKRVLVYLKNPVIT